MGMETAQLDETFFALSDPTRRAILSRLARGEATVTELVRPLGLSQPSISKHLKILERAGLIEGGRDGQRRPRRLAPHAIDDVAAWIDAFRATWERRFDNLAAHVAPPDTKET